MQTDSRQTQQDYQAFRSLMFSGLPAEKQAADVLPAAPEDAPPSLLDALALLRCRYEDAGAPYGHGQAGFIRWMSELGAAEGSARGWQ